MTYFFSFLLAMFATTALIMPLMRWAPRLGLVDQPDPRKVHVVPVPRVGGVAMVLAALLAVGVFMPIDRTMGALLLAIAVLFVFGVWDDRADLHHKYKFFGQIIAVSIVVFYGGVLIERVPFRDFDPLPPAVAVPLTYFALLGITNAINLSDGLDGLAGGTTLMSLAIVALLAVLAQDPLLATFSVVVMGSIFGFLRFNTHPARIFMGDTGSQFLGFTAGVLVVILTQKTNIALSPAMPLLLLGFPILDTFMVMAHRIRNGRSPFVADKNHTHHKLLFLGFDHYESVLLIYIAQAVLVVGAFFLRYQLDYVILGLYAVFCLLVIAFFQVTNRLQWRVHRDLPKTEKSPVSRAVAWLVDETHLPRWSFYTLAVTIPLYLMLGALVGDHTSFDIVVLALAMLACLVATFKAQKGKPFNIVERACIYITCAIIVYFVKTTEIATPALKVVEYGYFVMLILFIMLGMRFGKGRRFQLNTMDFLVILLAIIVPNLYMRGLLERHLSEGIAMLIVLFYGIEIIIAKLTRRSDLLRYALYVTLGLIGVKGLLFT